MASYARRNGHVLLFSPEFIEIRNTTGRIVQVIEGKEIRALYSGPYTKKENPILAMRGNKDEWMDVEMNTVFMVIIGICD